VSQETSPAPPPGSDAYYALLYAPRHARHELTIIDALKREICAIPVAVSDAGVARVKLEWWRTELARLVDNEPRHHLTQAYQRSYGGNEAISSALNLLISGLDEELGGRRLSTEEQQLTWFDTTFGPLYAAQATVLAPTEIIAVGPWQNLGRWIELGYSLLNLRPLAARNLERISQEKLSAAGCTWEDIKSGCNQAGIAKLVDGECGTVIKHITDILADSPTKTRHNLRPLLTLACLVRQTLVELRDDGCRVWQHRIELTPLRKLWLSWRMRFF
jgi:phytoene synthase